MIVAAVESVANSFYGKWGLLAVVITVVGLEAGGLVWLVQQSARSMTRYVLRVRGALATVFQKTVLDETLTVFELVDARLPSVLSQADAREARPSFFDRLVAELAELDPSDPDRELYATLIENAIGNLISCEARRVVDLTRGSLGDPFGRSQREPPLPYSFEKDTEERLTYIAERAGAVHKLANVADFAKKWGPWAFAASMASGLLLVFPVFCVSEWAESLSWALLSVLTLGAVCGLALTVIHARSAARVRDMAEQFLDAETIEDMMQEEPLE